MSIFDMSYSIDEGAYFYEHIKILNEFIKDLPLDNKIAEN
jgi:hypothetical protein